MAASTHFAFGTHPNHGFVATFSSSMPAHLAHWFLVREQFEPVPDQPGLFRLTEPERDGPRRTRQAVHDLRRHGYDVQTDVALDPAASASPPRPIQSNGLSDRRSRIAQAAAGQSPQYGMTPTASLPPARSALPEPGYAPTARFPDSAPGRSR
ncbi:hypothetical protein ABR737_33290 [Streptomyces sp. Edi2]|uniref:hypothetical protein n=1 Tax=Streptomyces sp. Edi2 TaxID=3162528 RepID=UPI003305F002